MVRCKSHILLGVKNEFSLRIIYPQTSYGAGLNNNCLIILFCCCLGVFAICIILQDLTGQMFAAPFFSLNGYIVFPKDPAYAEWTRIRSGPYISILCIYTNKSSRIHSNNIIHSTVTKTSEMVDLPVPSHSSPIPSTERRTLMEGFLSCCKLYREEDESAEFNT